MAQLRLFAQAREAAGVGRLDVPEGTVESVIRHTTGLYGEEYAAVVAASQIWINGEPADLASLVGAADEMAILPPVSGG